MADDGRKSGHKSSVGVTSLSAPTSGDKPDGAGELHNHNDQDEEKNHKSSRYEVLDSA